MSSRLTLSVSLLVAAPAMAQTQLTVSPFERVADQNGVATVRFDAGAHAALAPTFERGDVLHLKNFAVPGGSVDLVLRPVSAMADGATAIVMTATGEQRLAPSAAMFQGHVVGDGGSAFLSVSRTQISGYLSIDGELVFVSNGQGENPGRAWVTRADALPPSLASSDWCQNVSNLVQPSGPGVELGVNTPDVHHGDFFIELDEEFNDLFNTNQDAIDYANTLMTATSEVYRRDLGSTVNIPDGYMRLWNTTPPWGLVVDYDSLFEFQDWWNSDLNPDKDIERAGVHLFSNPVFGGIAYLPAICDLEFGYALSTVFGFFPYPIQHTDADNWDLFVTAHEWGHNHGSPHTFDYDPFFDACTDGTGPDSGTIMSYCHLEPAGTGGVGMRFHPEVQLEMRTVIEAAACFVVQPIALGDYDYDGDRDAADLAVLDGVLVQGFSSLGAEETFDMNQDGMLDSCDRDILDAIVNQPAPSAAAYNGGGSNPNVLSSSGAPAMGTTWTVEIDASGTGASATFLLAQSAPDSGSVFGFGELLLDLGSTQHLLAVAPVIGSTSTYNLPLTTNKVFVGFQTYAQGFLVTGGSAQATNALDVFLNFQ